MTTTYLFSNFAQSELQADITAAATSLQIATADASKFASPGVNEAQQLVIYDGTNDPEIVSCTARSGNTLTITRAQESTSAVAWEEGAKIRNVVTAASIANLQKTSGYIVLDSYLNEAKGSDIASASSIDLGAATGNFVHITGTTTITALGTVQAGTRRVVRFAGALTLTHNATSLILPSGANITTAANDTGIFVSEGSGNWRCVAYQKANGQALVVSATLGGSTGSTDNAILRADGTGGATLQNSAVTIDDSGNASGLVNITSTGKILQGQGAAIASASTVNLANATGNFLHVTGTTGISSFGTVAAGAMFFLYFEGAVTITHNASAIACLGSTNITTAAGEMYFAASEGGGLWRFGPLNVTATANIKASAVTLAKQANGTANRLQGFDGSGAPSEVSVTGGATLSGGVLNLPAVLSNGGYATNNYYRGGFVYSGTTLTVAANGIYAMPFYIGASATFTRVGLSITSAVVGNCRFALYTIENGVPTTLVTDFGAISTNSTGDVEATISYSATPGLYAMCTVFSATPTVRRGENDAAALLEHIVGNTGGGGSGPYNGWTANLTYGAYPSTFPSSGFAVASAYFPCAHLRVV